ncbi:MAG: hypothetical protein ACYC8T_27310, partial [Myxococcaceae bacterium]
MKRLATAVLLLAAGAASAQPIDVYGFNPRSIAMGGVQGSADGDAAAAYYNPALMREGSFSLGLAYSKPSLFVEPTAEPTIGQQFTSHLPPDYLGITLGFTVPIGGKLKDRA